MIQQDRLEKIWKRTVRNLFVVAMVALLILGSFFVQRLHTTSAPSFTDIAIGVLAVLTAVAALYVVARFIMDVIGRISGEK